MIKKQMAILILTMFISSQIIIGNSMAENTNEILIESDVTWTEEQKNKVIDTIPLKRMGSEKDIAETVKFLADSEYITGQIIKVDGGRSL